MITNICPYTITSRALVKQLLLNLCYYLCYLGKNYNILNTRKWHQKTHFFNISLLWCTQEGKLTDWPSEALFVSQGCCQHIWELCFQEPIHPSCKQKRQRLKNGIRGRGSFSEQAKWNDISKPRCSLFVPSAVMNEVFNQFLLYVDLYTLWKHKKTHTHTQVCHLLPHIGFAVNNPVISNTLVCNKPLPHRAMAHESTGLFHLETHEQIVTNTTCIQEYALVRPLWDVWTHFIPTPTGLTSLRRQ